MMDGACNRLAASDQVEGLCEDSKTWTVSPDDTLLAACIERGHVLLVLESLSCQVRARIKLTGPGDAGACLKGQRIFFSPSSQCIAVTNVWTVAPGESSVVRLGLVIVPTGDVILNWAYPTPGLSGVHAWTPGGLVCTMGGSSSTHAVHLLLLEEVMDDPRRSGDMPMAPTEASALVSFTLSNDRVFGVVVEHELIAWLAPSPCSTWLAIIGGQESAWNVQVLRATTGQLLTRWAAPLGPLGAPAADLWMSRGLTWSRNMRRLSVSVDANDPVYHKTYVLALDC